MITRTFYTGTVSNLMTYLSTEWKDIVTLDEEVLESVVSAHCNNILDTQSFSSTIILGQMVFGKKNCKSNKHIVPSINNMVESVSIHKILEAIKDGMVSGEYEVAYVNYIYLLTLQYDRTINTILKLISVNAKTE